MLQLPGITLRPAQESDLPQIVRLERLAFDPLRSAADLQQQWFGRGVNLPGRQLFLAEEEATGREAGCYTQLSLSLFFRGQEFPMLGIAGVAVAPEWRGQRIAQLLLEHAVHMGRQQKVPLSMLYPFQHGFYRKLGWAWVGQQHQYRVQTRHLPLSPERSQVVAYDADRHQAMLKQAYEQMARNRNGWLNRQEPRWQWRLQADPGRELFCYLEADRLLGYLILQYLQQDAGMVIAVQEWVALTPAAYRGLLGFLAALRDQVAVVIWNTCPEDPFPYLLREQQQAPQVGQTSSLFGLNHRFGQIAGSFMWRLIDLEAAFRLRSNQLTAPFQLTFQVADPILGNQTLPVQFADGQMQMAPSPTATVLHTSIDHLTELFCGLRRATDLVWTGEVTLEGDPQLLTLLDQAWQTPPPFCWDFF